MIIDDILNAVKATMQAESRLSAITKYHLVDGMIPGVKPCASISSGKVRFQDYDAEKDEAWLPVRVYVYMHHMDPEKGEQAIRELGQEVRFTLLENMYLGGLADESTVTDITFESAESQQSQVLHYALIDYEVKYYAPRQRPVADPPTPVEIDATFNSESISWME